jgi:BirA family biotin operon repressor/biotin-[acetyl-CoA-carboxylase] ligase
MASRQQVLSLLEQHKGSFVSGEEIARHVQITRAAVWRAISDLRSDGYEIEASTRVGYRLAQHSDKISAEGIQMALDPSLVLDIHYFDEIDSTNREAKRLAMDGAPQGTVVVAGRQSGGRGRLGRSFYSPESSGIYMSIILKPNMDSSLALRITSAAAVAVCRTIEQLSDRKAKIKWVNDIYLDDLKVCGILTEGISGFESGKIESVIVGIGLNHSVPEEGFPSDLAGIAGAVFPAGAPVEVPRNRMTAVMLENLFDLFSHVQDVAIMNEYRDRSLVLGRQVKVIQGDSSYEADAVSIANDGSLVVRLSDGRQQILSSGEISIRLR